MQSADSNLTLLIVIVSNINMMFTHCQKGKASQGFFLAVLGLFCFACSGC